MDDSSYIVKEGLMDLQMIWNIILSVLSFLLAAIAVVVSGLTLRQNSKMIESSTRPYIGVSCETVNTGTVRHILMIKNYGNSAGIIKDLKFDIDMHGSLHQKPLEPFEQIEETTILPSQIFSTVVDYDFLKENVKNSLEVKIRYTSLEGKKYENVYKIGVAVNATRMTSRTSSKNKELQTISYTLQEIAERLV